MDAVDEVGQILSALRVAARPPSAERNKKVSLLTQHLPLQRALRALGHAGLTCRRA